MAPVARLDLAGMRGDIGHLQHALSRADGHRGLRLAPREFQRPASGIDRLQEQRRVGRSLEVRRAVRQNRDFAQDLRRQARMTGTRDGGVQGLDHAEIAGPRQDCGVLGPVGSPGVGDDEPGPARHFQTPIPRRSRRRIARRRVVERRFGRQLARSRPRQQQRPRIEFRSFRIVEDQPSPTRPGIGAIEPQIAFAGPSRREQERAVGQRIGCRAAADRREVHPVGSAAQLDRRGAGKHRRQRSAGMPSGPAAQDRRAQLRQQQERAVRQLAGLRQADA